MPPKGPIVLAGRVRYDPAVGVMGDTGKRPLVLVVDDESGIAAMLADRLSHRGYRAIIASDGSRALDLVRQRAPDIILCDLYMPHMDGAAFIKQLRKDGVETPVILMSAGIEAELVALRTHAHGFLEKPFDMQAAFAAIEQLVGAAPD